MDAEGAADAVDAEVAVDATGMDGKGAEDAACMHAKGMDAGGVSIKAMVVENAVDENLPDTGSDFNARKFVASSAS